MVLKSAHGEVEGQNTENETPYQRRVKGKHMKRHFGSYSGRTSSGELQLI
jgi:hypothetical protein